MSEKELTFKSTNEAFQHLANLTGKRIKIAQDDDDADRLVMINNTLAQFVQDLNDSKNSLSRGHLSDASAYITEALEGVKQIKDAGYNHYITLLNKISAKVESLVQKQENMEKDKKDIVKEMNDLYGRYEDDMMRINSEMDTLGV